MHEENTRRKVCRAGDANCEPNIVNMDHTHKLPFFRIWKSHLRTLFMDYKGFLGTADLRKIIFALMWLVCSKKLLIFHIWLVRTLFLVFVCCMLPPSRAFLIQPPPCTCEGAAAIAEHEDDGTEQCDPGIFDTMAPNIAIESRLQSDDRACAFKSRLKGNEQAWPSSREWRATSTQLKGND